METLLIIFGLVAALVLTLVALFAAKKKSEQTEKLKETIREAEQQAATEDREALNDAGIDDIVDFLNKLRADETDPG